MMSQKEAMPFPNVSLASQRTQRKNVVMKQYQDESKWIFMCIFATRKKRKEKLFQCLESTGLVRKKTMLAVLRAIGWRFLRIFMFLILGAKTVRETILVFISDAYLN